ncbi:MAG: hypothetical protein JKX76_11525 [Colwellia sp.]|nr:hypothetical protein [Colwellia sp.]
MNEEKIVYPLDIKILSHESLPLKELSTVIKMTVLEGLEPSKYRANYSIYHYINISLDKKLGDISA